MFVNQLFEFFSLCLQVSELKELEHMDKIRGV